MSDSTSTGNQALVVRKSGDLEQTRELVAILTGEKDAPTEIVTDPEQAQHEMILRILSAGSEEELERSEAVGWSERLRVPYRILGYRWLPTQFRDTKTNEPIGLPVFLVVNAVNLVTGEVETLTTSSAQIVATIAKLDEFGRIPGAIRWAVRSEEKTRNGFYPMWLETPAEFADEDRQARQPQATETAAA